MILRAFAKINISLNILDKRFDGYYNINSIFQAVDLCDLISIKKAKTDIFLGSIVDVSEKSLTHKAKASLERLVNKKLFAEINLIKGIPIASGLGGGSSDAAAVIIGLNQLYNLKLTNKELNQIGLSIGSDVPFFLANYGRAKVSGMGEVIRKDNSKASKFYVIARPHKRILTKEIFEEYDKTGKKFSEIVANKIEGFERLYKQFKNISKDSGMSGSGPTLFAGFSDYSKADAFVGKFFNSFNGDMFICRSIKNTIKIL